MIVWAGNRTYKEWPPGEAIKQDRDATRWGNKNVTTSNDLYNACCYFICTGWPVEALEEFLAGIRPPGGWKEDWGDEKPPREQQHRPRNEYSYQVSAMFYGTWEPKK